MEGLLRGQYNTECQHLRGPTGEGTTVGCALHGFILPQDCHRCPDAEPLVFPAWEIYPGMTCVPERIDSGLAQRSTQSIGEALMNAGMPASPGAVYMDHLHQYGPFGNFLRAASDMAIQAPHASAYLICQDDVLLDPEAIVAVRATWSPATLPALVSLYTSPEFHEAFQMGHIRTEQFLSAKSGPHAWRRCNEGWNHPGACAYLFSGAGLRSLLTDNLSLWHRRHGVTQGMRALDAVVGHWAGRQHGGIWYYNNRSLATHIGKESTRGAEPAAASTAGPDRHPDRGRQPDPAGAATDQRSPAGPGPTGPSGASPQAS